MKGTENQTLGDGERMTSTQRTASCNTQTFCGAEVEVRAGLGGTEERFGVMEVFRMVIVGVVTPLREFVNIHLNIHFKQGLLIVCKL